MATQPSVRSAFLSVFVNLKAATINRLFLGRKPFEAAARRTFDIFCSLVGIALLAPVGLLVAVAIKVDDGGPVFYSQDRIGAGLRSFRLLKFRTMLASTRNESLLTRPRDARVTRSGRFLRKHKLDELPQLINVLRGEMRFVGVRPQVEKYVNLYRTEYLELLREPPGITGLASLYYRNEEQMYGDGLPMEQQYVQIILPAKLRIALEYSRTRTLRSDLEIILRTVLGLQPARVAATNGVESAGAFVSQNVSNPSA